MVQMLERVACKLWSAGTIYFVAAMVIGALGIARCF